MATTLNNNSIVQGGNQSMISETDSATIKFMSMLDRIQDNQDQKNKFYKEMISDFADEKVVQEIYDQG